SDEEVSIVSTSSINKGKQVVKGKYEATCNLCGVTWNHSEPREYSKKRKINTQGPLDQYRHQDKWLDTTIEMNVVKLVMQQQEKVPKKISMTPEATQIT
ncbi:8396_t:CDS:2, partial [Gigaspora margarita]